MTLSDALRIARQKSFLSQEAFAKQLNVSLSTVSRWETAKAKPNLSTLKAIKEFCQKNQISYDEIEKLWLNSDGLSEADLKENN